MDENIKQENICNYLLVIEKSENSHKEISSEIIPCNNITTAIKLASEEKKIVSLYEKAGSVAKTWRYLCDISKGIL